MMYGSWDKECNRQNFLSFVQFFALYFPTSHPPCPPPPPLAPIPLTTRKIKILKKWKKRLMILSFYTCVTKMRIIWCMVPEMRSMTDSIFCHFGPFFALLPHYQPEKSKFWKNKKNPWRYHFTHAYQKSWSHTILFLRYGTWWM